MSPARPSNANQSDLLLWVAGGGLAAVGIAWLLVMQPWAGSASTATAPPPSAAPDRVAVSEGARVIESDESTAPEATLDNPLRMAQLAYAAGMLVEPEEYSAWTLYARVAKVEPSNVAAIEGLMQVADDLVRRGETALDQGRFDDARNTVERIRAVLPAHAGATALAAKIWPQVGAQQPMVAPQPRAVTQRVARVEVPVAAPARPVIDHVAQASEAFAAAMAAGRLLTPTDQSAKHYVAVLVEVNADHELTQRARETLSRELLSRATQSVEALDAEAADIWIDEAEALGVDADGVGRARAALTAHLIAMESAKPMPASALKIVTYVAPEYPQRAINRRVEGWVDVEFTVGTDGRTRDITVSEGSHETMFRREAVAAIEAWEFEPRVFMGRTIDQRSYTRIRFVD